MFLFYIKNACAARHVLTQFAELKYHKTQQMAVNVHPDVLIKALAAIEPDAIVSLDHFQAASGILSRSVAKKVIDFLVANKIGSVSKSMIRFSGSDKLYMALLMLRMSCDIEEVSTCLSWKDFERLASEV